MYKFLLMLIVLSFQVAWAETLIVTETQVMALKSNEQLEPDIKSVYAKDFPDIDKLTVELIEPLEVAVAVNHLVSKTVIRRSYRITYENKKVMCRDNLTSDFVEGETCSYLIPISVWVPLVPDTPVMPRYQSDKNRSYTT